MRQGSHHARALAASAAAVIEGLECRTLLTAAGAFDPLFGDGGKLTTELIGSSWDSSEAVAVQPDGKVVIAGSSSSGGAFVQRHLADGSLDAAFGNGGKVELGHDRIVKGLALDSQGRIVVGGAYSATSNENEREITVTRLTPSGMPDPTFDRDGHVIKAMTPDEDVVNDVVVDAQDRIHAVGTAGNELIYFGLGADGATEVEFRRDAMPVTPLAGQRIALLQDGKVLIAGGSPTSNDVVVLRLKPEGTLDGGFGNSGATTATLPQEVRGVRSLAVQEDGRILVGADVPYESGDFAIARFLEDGGIDPSFDADGNVITAFGDGVASRVRSVLPLPGGKILAVGEAEHPAFGSQLAAARYDAGGSLDPSFGGGDGIVTGTHPADIPLAVSDAVLQPDGQVLVAGVTYTQMTDMDLLLARYTPEFDADASFGQGGHVRVNFEGPVPTLARGAAVGPDGAIVLAGVSQPAVAVVVAKYRPDGSLDETFGGTGIVRTGFRRSSFGADVASAVAVQADRKIVVAGHSLGNTVGVIDVPDLALVRYHPDGTLDAGFGEGGIMVSDVTGGFGGASIAIQPDGKILVASMTQQGTEDSDIAILRFNDNGSPDESFGSGGVARVDYGEDGFRSLALQPDGRIVVGGKYWVSRNHFATLTRLLPDGSLDPAFGAGGKISLNFSDDPQDQDEFFDVGLYRDGGGILAAARSGQDVILIRYGPDGVADDSFGVGGRVTLPRELGADVTRVLLQPDAKILLAGHRSAIHEGETGVDFFAARLNADGTTDVTFSQGGETDVDFSRGRDLLTDLLVLPTGGIVAAGSTRDERDTDFALAKLVNDAFITATPANDTIFARVIYPRDIIGPRLHVWINADPDADPPTHDLPLSSIAGLHIDAGAGNDNVTLETSNAFPRTTLLGGDGADQFAITGSGSTSMLTVEGGAGDDALAVDTVYSTTPVVFPIQFTGGDGADALTINGTAGDDSYKFQSAASFTAGNHAISTGKLASLHVDTGAGDDEITIDPDGIFPPVTIAGGDGNDSLDVNAAAGATVRVLRFRFDGQAGNDVLTARPTLQSVLPGPPRHAFDGGDGTDTFHLVGFDLNDAVSLQINGGVPYVSANGHLIELVNVEPTFYHTGRGDDALVLGSHPMPAHVDTGDGDDTLIYIGGTDREQITFELASVNDQDDRDTLVLRRGEFTLADDLNTVSSHLTVRTDSFAHVNFADSQAFAALEVTDGTAVTLSAGGDKTLTLRAVAVAPEGTLDLMDNDLHVLANAGNWTFLLRDIESWIGNARNAETGRWTGPGITTSVAKTAPLTGLAVWANDQVDAPWVPISVKYTWNGDANLDGVINADDYFRIDSGFLAQPASPLYRDGDFNYDDRIDADDYFLIDSAFLGQGAPLGAPVNTTLAKRASAGPVPSEPEQALTRKRPVRPIFSDEPVSVLGRTRRAGVARRR